MQGLLAVDGGHHDSPTKCRHASLRPAAIEPREAMLTLHRRSESRLQATRGFPLRRSMVGAETLWGWMLPPWLPAPCGGVSESRLGLVAGW